MKVEISSMKRYMRTMLISVAVLFGSIFLYKMIIKWIMKHAIANQSQVVYVSAAKVEFLPWQPKLSASGSMRAIAGVNVTTELAGIVEKIYFKPGAVVKKGTLLVQLRSQSEIAALQSLQARTELAKITYERNKKQFAFQAISKQTLDESAASLQALIADTKQQQAIVDKKAIRAPFGGRLGINLVDLGKYLNAGTEIVSLQTFDPIYVDFYLPQQALGELKVGQVVRVKTDTFKGIDFKGKITTIDSIVDSVTRNVKVQATILNPLQKLMPGMFVSVEIETGAPIHYLTVPLTAVSFNPYGSLVYKIKDKKKDKNEEPVLIAHQAFVTTGNIRGEQVAILKGAEAGETIVTSGQLKLKNGSQVMINNQFAPPNRSHPQAVTED